MIKNLFWVYRIEVIQSFLEQTNDYLVHSVIWILYGKKIFELFIKNNNTDLFFSQGNFFQKNMRKHNLFYCGFFALSSNEKIIKFMNEYINNLKKIPGDRSTKSN